MKKSTSLPSPRIDHDRLVEKFATLKETIDELRDRTKALEDEREALLDENRRLRRKLTQVLLLRDYEETIDAIESETGQLPTAPPSAERLYQFLPSSFFFSEFFRIAASRDLDMDEARQCLLHFLADDLVDQDGSRLVKKAETVQESK